MDTQLLNLTPQDSELPHHYGAEVHILTRPLLLSQLAELCSPHTEQPRINFLVSSLYRSLLETVMEREFPFHIAQIPTRMQADHAEAVYQGPALARDTRVVSVNLARAGTLPSQVCYEGLNQLLTPSGVRQDHISIGRVTDGAHHVQGSAVAGHKIGGPVDGAIVLLPDPMGATGGTLCETLKLYRAFGRPSKIIAMHCIVTPEYLQRVRAEFPELIVYSLRLDRGLSAPTILDTQLGTHWDQEKGLNSRQYIVPGGGGFGEILNNAYV